MNSSSTYSCARAHDERSLEVATFSAGTTQDGAYCVRCMSCHAVATITFHFSPCRRSQGRPGPAPPTDNSQQRNTISATAVKSAASRGYFSGRQHHALAAMYAAVQVVRPIPLQHVISWQCNTEIEVYRQQTSSSPNSSTPSGHACAQYDGEGEGRRPSK